MCVPCRPHVPRVADGGLHVRPAVRVDEEQQQQVVCVYPGPRLTSPTRRTPCRRDGVEHVHQHLRDRLCHPQRVTQRAQGHQAAVR